MLKPVSTSNVVRLSDKVRLAFLVVTGAEAILALTRLKHLLYVLGASGFVGPTGVPTQQDLNVLLVLGAVFTGLFVILGCGVVFDGSRQG